MRRGFIGAALVLSACGSPRPDADSTAALPPVGTVQPADSATVDSARRDTALTVAPAQPPATKAPTTVAPAPTPTVRPDTTTRRPLRDSVIQRRPVRVPVRDTNPSHDFLT